MDRHIRWLRRRMTRTLALRCALGWLAVAAAVLLAGLLWTDVEPLVIVLVALLAGQAAVALRVAIGLLANPLNTRYLRHYIANPPRFVAAEIDGAPHAEANALVELGLFPALTVRDGSGEDDPVFDLLQTADRLVTAAVGRHSGVASFMTKLDDDRIIHTTDLLVPPHSRLVVNAAPDASTNELGASHGWLLDELEGHGIHPVPTSPRLFIELAELEHNAYRDLGPLLGSFLNLDARRRPHRMTVRVTPKELLRLSLASAASRREVSIFQGRARSVAVEDRRPQPEAETVVVGAGNLGLTAAITLARAGRSVIVLEAGPVGGGASANGLGWLRRSRPDSVDLLPLDPAHWVPVSRAVGDAFNWTNELIDAFDIPCERRACGTDLAIDPFALNQGLVRVALEHGVVIHQHTPVLRVSTKAGPASGFDVWTDEQRLSAVEVVVTAGAVTAGLIGTHVGALGAIEIDYLCTEPLEPGILDIVVPHGRLPVAGGTVRRRLTDGRLLFAAPADGEDLVERLAEISPLVDERFVSHRWRATHTMTSDGLARAGRSNGVWWAVSGSPDDLASEPWLGNQLGLWIDGEAPPIYADLGSNPVIAIGPVAS